jgi:aspartate/methionine/tyrosine aminotransferase
MRPRWHSLAPQNCVQEMRHEHGVAVVHGAAYGPAAEGTLRVSFASGGRTLTDGLDSIEEWIAVAHHEQTIMTDRAEFQLAHERASVALVG